MSSEDIEEDEGERIYPTGDVWRVGVLMHLTELQQTIYEAMFLAGAIVFGYFLTSEWPNGPVVISAVGCVGALAGYGKCRRHLAELQKLADKASM